MGLLVHPPRNANIMSSHCRSINDTFFTFGKCVWMVLEGFCSGEEFAQATPRMATHRKKWSFRKGKLTLGIQTEYMITGDTC